MAIKIITCPWCGGKDRVRITYEENRVYQMKCYNCRNTMLHEARSFDRAVEFFEHQAGLVQAEKEGRLVVLPCKVGDTVYKLFDGKILEMRAVAIPLLISSSGAHLSITSTNYRGAALSLELSDFGKTVFLTREEAEAALAGEGKEPEWKHRMMQTFLRRR